jgi:hypothetical protein
VSLQLNLNDPIVCLPTAVTNKKAFSANNVMSELPAAVHEDQLATQPSMKKKKKKPCIEKKKSLGGKTNPLAQPTRFLPSYFFLLNIWAKCHVFICHTLIACLLVM